MQGDGFNSLAIAATGTNVFSSGGQAAGLALSVLDSLLTNHEEKRKFSHMVFSDEWLGEKTDDAGKAHTLAKQKTLEALQETAKAFDYDLKCKYDCDKSISSYELISTDQEKYKGMYHPQKIVAYILLRAPEKLPDDAFERSLFSQDTNFKAEQWHVAFMTGADELPLEFKEDIHSDDITAFYNQSSAMIPQRHYDLSQTPLGRNMLRHLSAQLPNWAMADVASRFELALTNGVIYRVYDTDSADDAYGLKTTQ